MPYKVSPKGSGAIKPKKQSLPEDTELIMLAISHLKNIPKEECYNVLYNNSLNFLME